MMNRYLDVNPEVAAALAAPVSTTNQGDFYMFGKLFFGSSKRMWAAAVLMAASLALPSPLARMDDARHTYLIQAEGEPIVISGVAEEELDFENLHVRTNLSAAVGDAQLLLREGDTLTLTVDGETVELTAQNETVDHLLRRMDAEVDDGEMVVLDVTGEELAITVTDSWEYNWEKVFPTTYTSERVANPGLTRGNERVKQEGQDGEYVESFVSVYRDGRVASVQFLGRSEDTAVPEIIEYGTASTYVASSDRIAQVVPNEDGQGGYLVFASGATMAYASVDTYNATAYDIHGITATGYPTEIGVVAVDPRIIPYGTRMFIQTVNGSWVYGMAVARDCGGAIKGKIIDLWFPDYETCCKWGRRDITVYFLDDISG